MKSLSIIFLVLVFGACQKQQNEDINRAKQASIDSMKMEIKKQKAIDSMEIEIAKIQEENKRHDNEKVTVINQPANTAAVPAKKKGWSGAAKGAVIGAGVGAATGAIVSKKKGEGAVIGGLVGAGVGAGTGAIIDDSTKNKDKK
ncbi:YMGG-like glycine zipper-containing protein [Flavobacterium aestuarii]|uniref:YMGG-like glycine zipper-containing protein n=1 Tax=Flavobacterium aestuarii TaxID=3149227 RepID=UPI0032B367A8